MQMTELRKLQDAPLTFTVDLSTEADRLDCAWFDPSVQTRIDKFRNKKGINRQLVRLESIAKVSGGKRLPKGTVIQENDLNTIPYIRACDVQDQKINLNSAMKLPGNIHQQVQNYQLQKNDLVLTIAGTIGEVGILEEKVEVCDFSENVARIRINQKSILPEFILHSLNCEYGKIQTNRFKAGCLQYKLSLNSCKNILVYIPHDGQNFDIKEQQKILDYVLNLHTKAEQKIKQANKLISEANSIVVKKLKIPLPDEFDGSIYRCKLNDDRTERLDALFHNPFLENLISNIKNYDHRVLGSLIEKQSSESISPSDHYRLVDLEQIDELTGRIKYSKEVIELGSHKIPLHSKHLLIAKLQPENGKVVVVSQDYEGAVGSSELIPFSLKSSDISLDYLWAVLRSDYVLKQWAYMLTGSSRMRIGLTEINQTIVPIPDKQTQNEIVATISGLIMESDRCLKESDGLLEQAKITFLQTVFGEWPVNQNSI